jgi:hypothetical protein
MRPARAVTPSLVVFTIFFFSTNVVAQDAPPQPPPAPASQPTADDIDAAKAGKLPFVKVDVAKKQVRVECEVIGCPNPLEFFCVVAGTSEHESVLRTRSRPSHVHLGLLMIGLEPGEPVHYIEDQKKWVPPSGPPLHITCEWTDKAGKTVSLPAYRMMRDVRSKREMPELTWIFTGSRLLPDGAYGADVTGYTTSVVNFELAMIDVPEIASSANETLEWIGNPDLVPPAGTKVTMIIEPAKKVIHPTTQLSLPPTTGPTTEPSTGGF